MYKVYTRNFIILKGFIVFSAGLKNNSLLRTSSLILHYQISGCLTHTSFSLMKAINKKLMAFKYQNLHWMVNTHQTQSIYISYFCLHLYIRNNIFKNKKCEREKWIVFIRHWDWIRDRVTEHLPDILPIHNNNFDKYILLFM